MSFVPGKILGNMYKVGDILNIYNKPTLILSVFKVKFGKRKWKHKESLYKVFYNSKIIYLFESQTVESKEEPFLYPTLFSDYEEVK